MDEPPELGVDDAEEPDVDLPGEAAGFDPDGEEEGDSPALEEESLALDEESPALDEESPALDDSPALEEDSPAFDESPVPEALAALEDERESVL